jgi:hypothetical protein
MGGTPRPEAGRRGSGGDGSSLRALLGFGLARALEWWGSWPGVRGRTHSRRAWAPWAVRSRTIAASAKIAHRARPKPPGRAPSRAHGRPKRARGLPASPSPTPVPPRSAALQPGPLLLLRALGAPLQNCALPPALAVEPSGLPWEVPGRSHPTNERSRPCPRHPAGQCRPPPASFSQTPTLLCSSVCSTRGLLEARCGPISLKPPATR